MEHPNNNNVFIHKTPTMKTNFFANYFASKKKPAAAPKQTNVATKFRGFDELDDPSK